MVKQLAFRMFFGGKPWYKSMVGWAALILLLAETAVPAAAEFGLADEAMMTKLTYYLERLAAACGLIGIRRRLPAQGVVAAAALALVILVGCGTSTITALDKANNPVTIEHRIGGRGCVAIEVGADGSISSVLQQDATSDWAGIRVIPQLLQTALTTMFGTRDPEPAGVEGPSDIGGCDGIFGAVEEEEPE